MYLLDIKSYSVQVIMKTGHATVQTCCNAIITDHDASRRITIYHMVTDGSN